MSSNTNVLISRTKKEQSLFDHRAKLLRLQAEEQKFRKLLSVDDWRSACLKAGFSSFQLLLKDPTGVSQQLSAYSSMSSYGNAWIWKKKACLVKLMNQLNKAKITYQSKAEFCAHIDKVLNAEQFETQRLMTALFDDIMAGKDKQHLEAFREACKKEFNEANLNFYIDVQAALKRNKTESDRNKRFDEHDQIMDKYSIRDKKSSDINVDDKLRLEWATAWSNGDESKCEAILDKIVIQVWGQCYNETFLRYWFAH